MFVLITLLSFLCFYDFFECDSATLSLFSSHLDQIMLVLTLHALLATELESYPTACLGPET